jgi:hypothetical protein
VCVCVCVCVCECVSKHLHEQSGDRTEGSPYAAATALSTHAIYASIRTHMIYYQDTYNAFPDMQVPMHSNAQLCILMHSPVAACEICEYQDTYIILAGHICRISMIA